MKNIITLYELIGLIKDNKEPKKIKYDDVIFKYSKRYKSYFDFEGISLEHYVSDITTNLDDTVEILPEENDPDIYWEDIEDITLNGETVGYGILKEWLDFTPNDNEQKICSCIETLGIAMNKLIKNQKYLAEKLENQDE